MSRRGWSNKEDEALKILVQKYGTKNWSQVARQLYGSYKFKERTGKQCRQRYHNHLDPRISKRNWTAQQQEILFKSHKIYGNKWTFIAEHLSGRTDNTIKNHFYSTIRRSLRRMSKLVGQKNSTKQMKYMKPSSLSKVFSINTKPSTEQQIQDQKDKCLQNFVYKQLVDFIQSSCQNLTDVILDFSHFKPKGKNCVLPPNQRSKFQEVLEKMEKLNEIYERMRREQRRINSIFKLRIQDSESDQSKEQQNQSVQKIQISKTTRSKRQIKPPKKFYETNGKKKISQQRKKLILLQKNSQLIRQLEKAEKQLLIDERMGLQKKASEKFPSDELDPLCKGEFEINLKNGEDNQQVHSQFLLTQTPSMTIPTSFYINTPALQMYQTPTEGINVRSGEGIFAHIQGPWSLKNGELQDIITNLGSQIARNGNSNLKDDVRTTPISNINCSPHSLFKPFH